MRTIKFRAWNKLWKSWINDEFQISNCGNYVYCCGDIFNRDEVELLQSTGLLDKNGVVIFEGDIVEVALTIGAGMGYDSGLQKQINIVEFCDYGFEPFLEFGLGDHSTSYKIIGNIYENKNLLEREDG